MRLVAILIEGVWGVGWKVTWVIPRLAEVKPLNHSRTMYLLRLLSKERWRGVSNTIINLKLSIRNY
jgi:hypothetical protein